MTLNNDSATIRTGFIDIGITLSGQLPRSMTKLNIPVAPSSYSNRREIHVESNVLYLDGEQYSTMAANLADGDKVRCIFDALTYAVIDRQRGMPLLHAALLSYNNHTILIPGKSESGKTTLSYLLHYYGAKIYSDELVGLTESTVTGFSRPLHLRKDVIEHLKSENYKLSELVPTTEGAYVSVCYQSTLVNTESLIVLTPDWQADHSEASLMPLSAATICQELMGVCVNARNFDDHCLSTLSRLARSARGFKLSYGKADSIRGALDQIGQLDEITETLS